VDWPKPGPGKEHIIARKDRFETEVLQKVSSANFNPYYGIRRIMEIEKENGLRSTFFFRPQYDDSSSAHQYAEDIKDLELGGWEVGVHLNDSSPTESVVSQKRVIDSMLAKPCRGTRVHYLRIEASDLPELGRAGFVYDSSLTFSKNSIDERNAKVLKMGAIFELPITIMDAYLFSYMQVKEEEIVNFVVSRIKNLKRNGMEFCSILWHDNVLLMRGGRKYEQLIQEISSIQGIEIRRGIDVVASLSKESA